MNLFFKLFGIVLIIAAATSLGFYKSSCICEEEKLLSQICSSLHSLREKIRLNYGEMSVIIPLCFSAEILNIKNGKVNINTKIPTIERQLLSEYFSTAGMGDIISETEKADTYISAFEKRLYNKQIKTKELCKLYRTVGFLCGLFLSIFMI
ncbi:MAG: hypothetical protein II317_02810 [Clostridia bacterium]|nr:hypothetical protein [Clostridia bacterium]